MTQRELILVIRLGGSFFNRFRNELYFRIESFGAIMIPRHFDACRIVSLQISAQESRRKKKEFVDTLERQVEVASQELDEYKKRCQGLEKENRYVVRAKTNL